MIAMILDRLMHHIFLLIYVIATIFLAMKVTLFIIQELRPIGFLVLCIETLSFISVPFNSHDVSR